MYEFHMTGNKLFAENLVFVWEMNQFSPAITHWNYCIVLYNSNIFLISVNSNGKVCLWMWWYITLFNKESHETNTCMTLKSLTLWCILKVKCYAHEIRKGTNFLVVLMVKERPTLKSFFSILWTLVPIRTRNERFNVMK